jgi:hexokinase
VRTLKHFVNQVVNMEWGNFWSSHLPRTPYDILLDDETHNRNDQGFEKMISGMYLGEIARLVFHRMAQESDVFGDAADSLSNPFILSTPFLAAIREDDSPDLSEVRRILREHLKVSSELFQPFHRAPFFFPFHPSSCLMILSSRFPMLL